MKSFFKSENLISLINKAVQAHLRFPLTLICALSVTVLSIIISEVNGDNNSSLIKGLVTFALGVPLFFSLEILNERKWAPQWITLSGGLLFLVLYYFLNHIETRLENENQFIIRTFVLGFVFHLAVAVLPYIKKGQTTKFWHYNKTIFLAILTAVLYSVTVFAGLSLALLALDKLFELNVDSDLYLYLWFCIAFYINTNIFVNYIPELDEIDKDNFFPKGLQTFTIYILLPLVAIYLLILISYQAKIVFQWSLPKGWVSNLVLASGVFGVLAFLLLFPIHNKNSWVKRFNKGFYWLMLPLVTLMFAAIYVRLKQYGFTEPRYFVLILGLWLLGISLYFILSKKDNIKIIPISLIIIGIISVYGPLSSFNVSSLNQSERLKSVLFEHNLLENGKIVANKSLQLSEGEHDKIHAALDYLSENKVENLEKYLDSSKYDELVKASQYNRLSKLEKWLGLPKKSNRNTTVVNIYQDQSGIQKAYKADYIIPFYLNDHNKLEGKAKTDELYYLINHNTTSSMHFEINNEDIDFDLNSLTETGFETNEENLIFRNESNNWKAILVISQYHLYENKNSNLSGNIYLIRK